MHKSQKAATKLKNNKSFEGRVWSICHGFGNTAFDRAEKINDDSVDGEERLQD